MLNTKEITRYVNNNQQNYTITIYKEITQIIQYDWGYSVIN